MIEKIALTIPGGTNNDGITFRPIGGVPGDGGKLLTQTLPILIQFIFIIAILLALLFLIFGGFKWITSGGDKAGIEGARKTITYSIIGLIIVFLSYFIVNIIGNFFGVNLLNQTCRMITQGVVACN